MNDNCEAGARESTAQIETDASPGSVSASNSNDLAEKARQAIHAGRVPSRKPEAVWGGPGSGVDCVICGSRISGDQLGFELEFVPDDGSRQLFTRHVHIPCFAAWENECQTELQREADDGTMGRRDRHTKHERRGR